MDSSRRTAHPEWMGFGKDGKGAILKDSPSQPLLTLAASTGIILAGGNVIGAALLERFRIIKSEISARVTAATFAAGDGPIALYMVDGDLSLAEFEASIELAGPVGPNDTVIADLAERWSMRIGEIPFIGENEGPGSLLNRGIPIEKVIRWTFARAKGWNWIAYNEGTALTTGATIEVRAKHFGVWVT